MLKRCLGPSLAPMPKVLWSTRDNEVKEAEAEAEEEEEEGEEEEEKEEEEEEEDTANNQQKIMMRDPRGRGNGTTSADCGGGGRGGAAEAGVDRKLAIILLTAPWSLPLSPHCLSGTTFSLQFRCPEPPLRALGEAFVCLSVRREGVLDMLGLKEACQGQVALICRAQRANVGVQLEIKGAHLR